MNKSDAYLLEGAARAVRDAIRQPGANPPLHFKIIGKHRTEWRSLWDKLDTLVGIVEVIDARHIDETGRSGGW